VIDFKPDVLKCVARAITEGKIINMEDNNGDTNIEDSKDNTNNNISMNSYVNQVYRQFTTQIKKLGNSNNSNVNSNNVNNSNASSNITADNNQAIHHDIWDYWQIIRECSDLWHNEDLWDNISKYLDKHRNLNLILDIITLICFHSKGNIILEHSKYGSNGYDDGVKSQGIDPLVSKLKECGDVNIKKALPKIVTLNLKKWAELTNNGLLSDIPHYSDSPWTIYLMAQMNNNITFYHLAHRCCTYYLHHCLPDKKSKVSISL